MVGRSERAEFDLDELGRRKFEFIFCLGRRIVTIALAEPADAVDREFLLTFKANAGSGGKSKNVFGLYIAFTPKMFMTAAWNTQVWGREVGNPVSLNLAEFQRNRARLKFAWEF